MISVSGSTDPPLQALLSCNCIGPKIVVDQTEVSAHFFFFNFFSLMLFLLYFLCWTVISFSFLDHAYLILLELSFLFYLYYQFSFSSLSVVNFCCTVIYDIIKNVNLLFFNYNYSFITGLKLLISDLLIQINLQFLVFEFNI